MAWRDVRVTIGIGYDCGYASANTIRADWGDKLPTVMVEQLVHTSGIKGSPASLQLMRCMAQLGFPFDAAMAVFTQHDMPKWEGIVSRALPNTDLLSSDSFGALVSLAYNRGASFDLEGTRYTEMRSIHTHMANKNFSAIPDDIRSMKRLWPSVAGLHIRRDAEAGLFQRA